MQLEDRISIVTPEGVPVEMVVAGIGSRFIAGMLDVTLEVIGFFGVLLTFRALGISGGVGLAVLLVLFFAVFFGF
ncbi:MAG: RDD family protein, partial [Acidimicrobiia bacterium]